MIHCLATRGQNAENTLSQIFPLLLVAAPPDFYGGYIYWCHITYCTGLTLTYFSRSQRGQRVLKHIMCSNFATAEAIDPKLVIYVPHDNVDLYTGF